jgi:hypothetical protein
MQVNHICNVPDCCNPEHLKLGTPQSNMDDMVRDGRGCDGVGRVLFTKDVIEVLRLVSQGWSYASIARKFGVSDGTIGQIAHGETYKDIPGERVPVRQPTSRFFGVTYNKSVGKWRAKFNINGKTKNFGSYASEVEAALRVNYEILTRHLDKPLNEFPGDDDQTPYGTANPIAFC